MIPKLSRFLDESPRLDPPVVGAAAEGPMSAQARASLRAPIVAGMVVIAVCVVGLGLWASLAPIRGAVVANGVIRVEANRKTLKTRDGGVVRAIAVRDGDIVKAGQLLMRFDDTVPQAQVDVLGNQHDNLEIQRARFLAEVTNKRVLQLPPDLAARRGDPRVSAVIQNETLVFTSRLAAVDGQSAILNQRLEQLLSTKSGLQLQLESIDSQIALIAEELKGYQTLYEKGFAPKTLILRLQRQLAEIGGRRGALIAEMNRNQQQSGETRLQLAQIYEQRASEAATGLRDAEGRLADLAPRLNAAREALAATRVLSPSNGYVLNLSQHTIGGVAVSGEPLMDVVPSNAPLVVSAEVKPSDIDEVRPGMTAEVSLSAYSAYKVGKVRAEVLTVSADALVTEKGGSYYRADLRILPEDLKTLPKGVKLYPGMPATAMIQTGKRTIMSYLLQPIGMVLDNSMREQ